MSESVSLPDPASYPNRACRSLPQDVFFPDPRSRGVDRARKVCLGCPRLGECAAWAAPRVQSGALSGCVVATVVVPGSYRNQATKDATAAALTRIATALAEQQEGAA